jgi:hypothetical protein
MKRILLIGVGRWGVNHLRVLKSIKSAVLGHQSLRCLESFIQIVPRSARSALDEIATNPIRNRRFSNWP